MSPSDNPKSLRDRLLAGEPHHFDEHAPEADRTIEAGWVIEAVARGVPIDLRHAVVVGSLALKYSVVQTELSLVDCQITQQADLSYAVLRRNVTLSKTHFQDGIQLRRATFEHDLLIDEASVERGTVNFSDMEVKGSCQADGFCTGDSVEAILNRAQFDKIARFLKAQFGGPASFRGVHFGDQAAFQGAVFKARTSFNAARIAHHLLLRSEPATNIAGATFEGPVDFSGARVGGQAGLTGAVFKQEATFDEAHLAEGLICSSASAQQGRSTIFEGPVRFVGTRILARADFGGVVFKQKLDLGACHIEGDASFQGSETDGTPAATCEDEASFQGARITGTLDCRGMTFRRAASFSLVTIGGNALFTGIGQREGRSAVFDAGAKFGGARICGHADFRGTTFNNDVSFNLAKLEGGAFFRAESSQPAARFGGSADFKFARFDGEADFQQVVFDREAGFTGAQMRQRLELTGAAFKAPADFSGIMIGNSAGFASTVFDDTADFTGAQFAREANFQDATFAKLATFSVARMDGDTFFNRAKFKRDGDGEADFRGARFRGVADFQGTVFEAPVDFYAARGDGLVRFEDGVFHGSAKFREAAFTALHFSDRPADPAYRQFQDAVDLIGCSYEHIQTDWRSLMAHLEPYDRQPFTQLEKVFRAGGHDREADAIYLERQRRERLEHWRERQFGAWSFSLAYRLIANYGVRPYQLLVASVALIVAGTLYFSVRETVVPADPPAVPTWARSDALAVTLHQFLPVDVAWGARWAPSEDPVNLGLPWPLNVPAFFATVFLRLAGWILVPLGVAALTGLLRVRS